MDNKAPATDNPVDYIQHHLQPLAVGDGFWRINIDTMFFSILLAGFSNDNCIQGWKDCFTLEHQQECKTFLNPL